MAYSFDTVYKAEDRIKSGSIKWMDAAARGMEGDTVPFTVADMEFPAAPEIIQAVGERVKNGFWGYTTMTPACKQAAASWMKTRHGWDCDPAWVVPTHGIVQAIYAAVRAFTRPGDGVIVQTPVYPPFYTAVEENGRVLCNNPLRCVEGRYEMDYEGLARCAKEAKLLLLCSPHNPVGRVWRKEELSKLADICAAQDVIVFADEIHGDLIMPGFSLTPYGTLPGAGSRFVVGTSASKSFSLAGLGCASMWIPDKALRGDFEAQMHADGAEFNSAFGVAATQAAYTKGGPWLDELIQYIAGNFGLVRDYMQERLPQIKVYPMEGTYLCWLDCSALGAGNEVIERFLHKAAKWYLNNGKMFGQGGEGFFRMNLACPRPVLEQALERLGNTIAQRALQGDV